MKKSVAQNLHDGKIIMETEKEIQKNVDELVEWLGGTVRYFVRSIKALSELSNDKLYFRSYVTEHIFKHLDRLSEIADIYSPDDTAPDGEELSEQDLERILKKCMSNYDVEPDNFDDLGRYYASVITATLAVNHNILMDMRLHLSALKFISKSSDDFGSNVLDYICEHILHNADLPACKRMADSLCLVMAIMGIDSKLFGNYAEVITDIIDKISFMLCMNVTNDYLMANKKEDKPKKNKKSPSELSKKDAPSDNNENEE